MLDINGLYNLQNERIWAINRGEANGKCSVKRKQNFSQNEMVWLGKCSGGIRH